MIFNAFASRAGWLVTFLLCLQGCASETLETAAAGVCERRMMPTGTCWADSDGDSTADTQLACGEAIYAEHLATPQYLLCQCQPDGSAALGFLSSVDASLQPGIFQPDLDDPACSCSEGGIGLNGEPIAPQCGQSVCGLGAQMFLCADNNMWVDTGEWCDITSVCTRSDGAEAAALCSVPVNTQTAGLTWLAMETDYLPHVVACENGGADLESLKAQAIAARSVAYHHYEVTGTICDSQQCQVYTCYDENETRIVPSALHRQAVDETRGMVLRYNGNPTYAFYVAGDKTTSREQFCRDVGGLTSGHVTYNQWKYGADVRQSSLGLNHPPSTSTYGYNRGCMSQWGSRCLERSFGYDFYGILSFYYGADIEVVQKTGDCVPGF